MKHAITNTTSKDILFDNNGVKLTIKPGEAVVVVLSDLIIDGINFSEEYARTIKKHFSIKISSASTSGNKCSCSSYQVNNFGCKCGGK